MKPNKPSNKHHNKAHDKTKLLAPAVIMFNSERISIESDPIGLGLKHEAQQSTQQNQFGLTL